MECIGSGHRQDFLDLVRKLFGLLVFRIYYRIHYKFCPYRIYYKFYWFLGFIINSVLAQVKSSANEKFSYSSPCRQGKIYYNSVLAESLLVRWTHLLLGRKFWIHTTSRGLRFFLLYSRTHFFLMTHTLRKPVSNLNTFLISGEVFSDLWLQATGSLLKNHPNEHVQKIITNRTQTRIPSFELAIRICCAKRFFHPCCTSKTDVLRFFFFW